jgi:queuine/archaeosine tRNA-ribosyltransferase
MRLMEKIRTALNEGNFLQFKNEFLTKKGGA